MKLGDIIDRMTLEDFESVVCTLKNNKIYKCIDFRIDGKVYTFSCDYVYDIISQA